MQISGVNTYNQISTYSVANKTESVSDKITSSDSADISKTAKNISSLLNKADFGDRNNDGVITGDELKEMFNVDMESFTKQFKAELKERGISSVNTFDLFTDSSGRVKIKGENKDKQEIEKIFQDNPEIENLFRKLDSTATLISHMDEHLEFARLYEKNPSLAVSKFSHFFNGRNKTEFIMNFNNSDFTHKVKKTL